MKNMAAKKNKESDSEKGWKLLKELIFDKKNWELLVCILLVSILFVPTLIRPWLIYDERIIFDGLYFPTASTFGEIFEIIEKFGLNFNALSSNTIYSSNYITRSCPFGQLLGVLLTFFFKREPVFYHAFNLIFHLINTCLVYFILKIFTRSSGSEQTTFNRILICLLTVVWAVHPAMVEPVLLSTNFGAGFSYFFLFAFLLDFLINKEKNKSDLRKILIPFLFLIPMLTNEYIVTLPLVFFIIAFQKNYQVNPLNKAFKISATETKPYFYGLLLYIIYFLFVSHYKVSQPFNEKQLLILVERVFWLSPQVFFHFLKLVFYPKILSIDQTLFVHLGKAISDPYAIFCILFLSCWLFIPLFLFLKGKWLPNLFLLCWTFFFALMPFLHVFMPSYTLAAERYLYAPLAFFIFSIAKIFSHKEHKVQIPVLFSLSIILVLCFSRSFYRTFDWKDNYSFINSSYETSKDPLFKAMRLGMLGKAILVFELEKKDKIKDCFFQTLGLLEEAKRETLEKKLKYQKSIPEVIKSY